MGLFRGLFSKKSPKTPKNLRKRPEAGRLTGRDVQARVEPRLEAYGPLGAEFWMASVP